MRFLGGVLVGVLLAFGIATAHDYDNLADHHDDCAEERWEDRPGGGGGLHLDWAVALDPDSSHDTIIVTPGVCHQDVSTFHLAVELWHYEAGRSTLTGGHAVAWHVGADGMARGVLAHLEPDGQYTVKLRRAGHHLGSRAFRMDPAPPTAPATTSTSTTTTLPVCEMPTTTTTTTSTTTSTTTTEAPAVAVMPGLLGQGILKATAEQWITDAGLVPAGRAVPTDNPDLHLWVFAQDPPQGATLTPGSAVTFDYWQYTPPEG